MKKEIRKENKIKRALKRLLKSKNKKIHNNVIVRDNLLPRKIRRNKTRTLIKEDGLTKVNKRMKYYWKDVQAGAYKI